MTTTFSIHRCDDQSLLDRLTAIGETRSPIERVIVVAGSHGKSTTCDMIRAVLGPQRARPTTVTPEASPWGTAARQLATLSNYATTVVEFTGGQPDEIVGWSRECRPQLVCVTRCDDAEGSTQQIATLTALLNSLPDTGLAILNADDLQVRRAAQGCRARIIWVGRSMDSSWEVTNIRCEQRMLQFTIDGQTLCVSDCGRHLLPAALIAVVVGRHFGLDWDEVAAGLAQFRTPEGCCHVEDFGGITLIDDTYNADATAASVALELIHDLPSAARRVVVCGGLTCHGQTAVDAADELGQQVVHVAGADLLLACGPQAQRVAGAACEAGMSCECAMAVDTPEAAARQLGGILRNGDSVLILGIRGIAMQRCVDELRAACLTTDHAPRLVA